MNARNLIYIIIVGLSLASCAAIKPGAGDKTSGESSRAMTPGEYLQEDILRPKPRPESLESRVSAPAAGATSVEEFDTTSNAERQAATNVSADAGGERALGRTIASLGSPAQPGFWLETPLVSAAMPGRVVALATGESVLVKLLPAGMPEGAGSQVSLAALRLLGVDLAGLHEIEVYAR